MGIRADAGKILLILYKEYSKGEGSMEARVNQETNWDSNRIRTAIKYLNDRGFIKVTFFIGGNFFVERLYPSAIDTVEDESHFKIVFGSSKEEISRIN